MNEIQASVTPTRHHIKISHIARDVAIIWLLPAMAGFVGSFGGHPLTQLQIVAGNFLFGIVGFTIAGCLTTTNRWAHLRWVAIGTWLVALPINVLLLHMRFVSWIWSILFLLLIMAVGGGLASAFRKETAPDPAATGSSSLKT